MRPFQDGRKISPEESKDLRKEIKRMRNKEAARRSRDRRKATMAELEGINALLQEQIVRANTKLRRMRREINDLSECNSKLRRATTDRHADVFSALIEAVGSKEKAEKLVQDVERRRGRGSRFANARIEALRK